MGRRLVTLLVVVVIFVCMLADYYSPVPPARLHYDVDDTAFNKVKLINLSTAEGKAVRVELRHIFHPQCTVAFSESGLRSPLEVATEEGVVLRTSVDLHIYSAKELGLVSDVTRKVYWEEFSSVRAQAGTVSARSYGVRLTRDGRARVFLHDTAFQGESFIFGKLSLREVLIHEFMHVGGQPPTPGWFFQHDLAGFEHYDKIMKACR